MSFWIWESISLSLSLSSTTSSKLVKSSPFFRQNRRTEIWIRRTHTHTHTHARTHTHTTHTHTHTHTLAAGSPARIRTRVLRMPFGHSNHWVAKPRQELRANTRLKMALTQLSVHFELRFSSIPAVGSSFFDGKKGEKLIRNDPGR